MKSNHCNRLSIHQLRCYIQNSELRTISFQTFRSGLQLLVLLLRSFVFDRPFFTVFGSFGLVCIPFEINYIIHSPLSLVCPYVSASTRVDGAS